MKTLTVFVALLLSASCAPLPPPDPVIPAGFGWCCDVSGLAPTCSRDPGCVHGGQPVATAWCLGIGWTDDPTTVMTVCYDSADACDADRARYGDDRVPASRCVESD